MKNQGLYNATSGHDFTLIAQQQIDLIKQVLPLKTVPGVSSGSYKLERTDAQKQKGILTVHGQLENNDVVSIRFEVLRTNDNARIHAGQFFHLMGELSDKTHVVHPSKSGSGPASLWLEMKVQASPMSMTRSAKFHAEIVNINRIAEVLQSEVPELNSYQDLAEQYKSVADIFEPVVPYDKAVQNPEMASWLSETLEMYSGGLCQAFPVQSVLQEKYLLAALATQFLQQGSSLGKTIPPVISAVKLPELLKAAPGCVAIPAVALSMGTNPYERGNEILSLLQALTFSKTPAFFTGESAQLQNLFHGGQGGKNDPLLPVVRSLPPLSPLELIEFGVENEASLNGGLAAPLKQECIGEIAKCFQEANRSDIDRLLPAVIIDTVKRSASAGKLCAEEIDSFREKLHNRKATLGGLAGNGRISRFSHVQEKFNEVLVDPGLANYFNSKLFAQEDALNELARRLQMEALTRPLYQPIRYCAQGTPGTGKSESTVLLAKLLGVPFINIDAASIPDFYTASAQLLGSARGIVGSHQAGRLEQAAKHRLGAVVEISDLDHANPAVRSAMADLFLQLLETGEAQSAAGAMFSCANLIFVFTINLPNGQDEFVRQGMGFLGNPDEKEIRKRIHKELKKTFSTAFISRIGNPILFNPLAGSAKLKIVEKACNKAVREGAERLNVSYEAIAVDDDTRQHILDQCTDLDLTSGARGIMEKTRSIVAGAILEQSAAIRNKTLKTLQLKNVEDKTILSFK